MKKITDFLKRHWLGILGMIIVCILSVRIPLALADKDEETINREFYNKMIDEAEQVQYTVFTEYLTGGQVSSVYYMTNKEKMVFTLIDGKTEDGEDTLDKTYVTYYPAGDDFRENLLLYGIDVILVRESQGNTLLLQLVFTLIPSIIMIGTLVWLMKGVSPYKDMDENDAVVQRSNVRLEDIVGLDEVMDEIQLIVKLINNPSAGAKLGAKIPHGILLSGPAGVGKTMIAKAISNAADVPFISMNGSDFQEIFVGTGAKRVRQLFSIARKKAPCIVFVDEFDAIGTKRDSVKSNSEDTKTINALLKEMDGFRPLEGVFVIAATNFPEKLDSAVTRAGRFDREIAINPPKDWRVREQLFKMYLDGKPLAEDVDIKHLAKTVGGFTGADIATVCNEASLVALGKGKGYIDLSCIEEAIDKKVFKGSYSKDDGNKNDKEIVAYHEAGHAVMAIVLGQPVSRASIRSTTSGVGGAVFHEDKDSQFITQSDLEDRIMVLYAGRVSEDIKFSDVTTGASNDIEKASSIIYNYVCTYGFSDFPTLNVGVLREHGLSLDKVVYPIVEQVSNDLYRKAFDTLEMNYHKVEMLARKLLEVNVMTGSEILEFLNEDGSASD